MLSRYCLLFHVFIIFISLPRLVSASSDLIPDSNALSQNELYSNFESIDGSKFSQLDIKGKQLQFSMSDTIDISDWQVQNLAIHPGDSKSYNFTVQTDDAYSTVAFISANICKYPESLNNPDSLDYLKFYQSYDNGDTYFPVTFDEGYYQSVDWEYTESTNGSLSVLLYIEVSETDKLSSSDYFQLQFAISTSDLVFQWDNGTFVDFVDSDDDSAFFQTGKFNLTTNTKEQVINGTSSYSIHVFKDESSNYFNGLSKSWCAVNSATALISDVNIKTFHSKLDSDFRKLYYVDTLNSSSDYIAYITRDIDGTGNGGIVYSMIQFQTETKGVCELVYGLNFCDMIQYSIPQSLKFTNDLNKTSFQNLYDDYAYSIFENFTKIMEQIPCGVEDDARFSPLTTCNDCLSSYKNWICSIVFPRCTTDNKKEYLLREVGNSRSDFMNNVVQPPHDYYEILPCINTCHAIVRDCPTSIGFSCPTLNDSLLQSYNYIDDDRNYTTCNLVGNVTVINGSMKLKPIDYKLLMIGILMLISLI